MRELILNEKLESDLVRHAQSEPQAFTDLYEHYFFRIYKYVYYT